MAEEKNKYIIVTHKLFTGAGQELYKYFRKNRKPALLIEHYFLALPERRSVFSYFDGEREKIHLGLNYRFFPDVVCYIKDFIYSLYAVVLHPGRYRVYFGCGGFNVLSGLFLKLFGRVEKVVFYTIDFVPDRFNNRLLDSLYLAIDKFAVRYAEQTWNLCERMVEGREKYNNMPKEIFNRQKTVPVGVWLDDFPPPKTTVIKNKILVFSGHLLEHFGVQLVLECIPEIIKKVPHLKFLIIGDGPDKSRLIKLTGFLGVENSVEFLGPLYDQRVLIRTLSSARVGIAPYREKQNWKVYFADSTKPKLYLACALPLIITRVAWIHKEVERRKMGISINYDKQQLTEAVVRLMTDDELYLSCRINAKEFIQSLDWNNIFPQALKGLENA